MDNLNIKLSDDENSLSIVHADCDGFHIVEHSFPYNKVYVYYSEIPLLIQHLRRVEKLRNIELL